MQFEIASAFTITQRRKDNEHEFNLTLPIKMMFDEIVS